jgi:hypothetical protein
VMKLDVRRDGGDGGCDGMGACVPGADAGTCEGRPEGGTGQSIE